MSIISKILNLFRRKKTYTCQERRVEQKEIIHPVAKESPIKEEKKEEVQMKIQDFVEAKPTATVCEAPFADGIMQKEAECAEKPQAEKKPVVFLEISDEVKSSVADIIRPVVKSYYSGEKKDVYEKYVGEEKKVLKNYSKIIGANNDTIMVSLTQSDRYNEFLEETNFIKDEFIPAIKEKLAEYYGDSIVLSSESGNVFIKFTE